MPAPRATEAVDTLTTRAHAALSARLDATSERPIALALSGGGDSLALLAMTVDWARGRGRRVLALSVDHGLHPDSARWTATACDQARALGADWQGLAWTGPKPPRGLAQAARNARHALIAEAARAAGARVILFGHTADDVAEGDWMRAHGATLGRLSDWSPSPVWPEGRDLMLARPLLGARRTALRDWLRDRGLSWIDDPANDDPASLRAQARLTLAASAGEGASGVIARSSADAGLRRNQALEALETLEPMGGLVLNRTAPASALAAAVVCVGGGARPPRGGRLSALMARLTRGEDFIATLCGARLQAQGDQVTITREAGERRRSGLAPLTLAPGVPTVWDGRFEIVCDQGGRITALAGHAGGLSPQDRVILTRAPAAVRPGLPVLFHDDDPRPVLAWRAARVRCLVPSRFALAVGHVGVEDEIAQTSVGEMAPNILFHPGDGARAP